MITLHEAITTLSNPPRAGDEEGKEAYISAVLLGIEALAAICLYRKTLVRKFLYNLSGETIE